LFYQRDSVRLTRELPEHQLPLHAEGRIESVIRTDDGAVVGAEVAFYTSSGTVTATLPTDAIEPVLASTYHRTAVFWGLRKLGEKLVESAMHAMLDRDFGMSAGLNVVRLHYVAEEHWWKWGDRMNDQTGAHAVTAASSWDGMVIALAGRERFQLEFRLAARKGPVVLLHERDETYFEQSRATPEAMRLARTLLAVFQAVEAEYCAFPVADPWISDEDWLSLLQQPYYPDFFLLPQAHLPNTVLPPYRFVRMTDGRAMMTAMPVKFSPTEAGIERSEHELKLAQLRRLKALGEKYYDQMYETHLGLNGLYSSAKDAFYEAISLANELGLKEESKELEERLAHIKGVFRSQFS
jgi:hypothetical protein